MAERWPRSRPSDVLNETQASRYGCIGPNFILGLPHPKQPAQP